MLVLVLATFSWYGVLTTDMTTPNPAMVTMASGEPFSPQMYVVAQPTWRVGDVWVTPFREGDVLVVTVVATPTRSDPRVFRSLRLRIADTCPGCGELWPRRRFDLTAAAWRSLTRDQEFRVDVLRGVYAVEPRHD